MNLANKRLAGLLLLLATVAGCSDMNPGEDTYTAVFGLNGGAGGDDSVGASGSSGSGGSAGSSGAPPEVPEAWACMGEPRARTAVPMGTTEITYRVPIVDFDSQPNAAPIPVPNPTITFCTNAACTDTPDVAVSNPDPNRPFVYDFKTRPGLSGLTVKVEATGYVTMYYILGGPMVGTPSGSPVVGGQGIPLLKTSARDGLYFALGLGTPAAMDRGDVAVRTLNCTRDAMTGQTIAATRASGVALEALPEDMNAIPYSLTYGNQAIAEQPTDTRGVAGFASLMPRNYTVWGIAPIGDEGMEFGRTTIPVRAGAITLLEVRDGQGDSGWGQ